ncbi:hypothetical protein BEL04_21810 [Mucilaginibacter sp. PPCGB 2223]|uniref:metallophosphoesterase n=1 Tax=Mucilaginibacter sp. PPCGB 2223 TaxID=1886027 RepID=UPI000826C98E|nr:metallophosphoesterase [Mucilaginibacter sp. PPCGB 2223]OCX50421.1 hypothetical protein BEL04_21810 [Mucilaginibacter sp. PPCGB 2223]
MKKLCVIILVLVMIVANIRAQPKPTATGNILTVSDIHLNPYFDPSLMDKLVKSDYKQWPTIFNSSSIKAPNTYNSDSNFPLFVSALAAMKKQNPSPAFIIITGDFLCHSFQSNYAKYAPNYPDSVRSFTSKTIQVMALMLDKYFPKTVVLPVLGNNDSFCGDYMIDPGGEFLNMFAKAWVPLQRSHNAIADKAFVTQFGKGGYYTYDLKDGSGGKMVMLNTIFFSTSYNNSCETHPAHPAADELNWLARVLKQNQAKKLWLAAHIPPGIDVNKTINGKGTCAQNVRTMWRDSCNMVFQSLVIKYAAAIKAGFAGHTHMDDFRLLYNAKGVPVYFMHITPAVSPLFGNNPGFQNLSYSKSSFVLLDSKTYYYSLNTSAPAWTFEYDFNKTYGVGNITPASLDVVRKNILSKPACLTSYVNYYDMSNPQLDGINNQNWKAYWCATGNLTTASYTNCYCGGVLK